MDITAIINDWAVMTSHNRLAGVSQAEAAITIIGVVIANIVGD